jgi:hypothetical protein
VQHIISCKMSIIPFLHQVELEHLAAQSCRHVAGDAYQVTALTDCCMSPTSCVHVITWQVEAGDGHD